MRRASERVRVPLTLKTFCATPGGQMDRYLRIAGSICMTILLLGYLVCAFVAVGTVVCYVAAFGVIDNWFPLIALPFLAMAWAIWNLRRRARKGAPPGWAYLAFLASVVLALPFCLGFFTTPMHDIGLWFGSHGRWACARVNADGSHHYLIRASTVPWLLMVPLMAAAAFHWIIARAVEWSGTGAEPPDGSDAAGDSEGREE